MNNMQLWWHTLLREKTNGEWNDLSAVTQKMVEWEKAQVIQLLEEWVSHVIDKIVNGVYEIFPHTDKLNQREVKRWTWEYIHTFSLSNGEIMKVIYQSNNISSIDIVYKWEIQTLSGEKFQALKIKMKKIYSLPVFHSNPDGTPRGVWV